jgi:hypothetical protein
MNLQGIVNRIWQDPEDKVVSLMLQGKKEIHRFFVHEITAEEVGLTKPGDVLQVKLQDGPEHPSATQWNNETLAVDLG